MDSFVADLRGRSQNLRTDTTEAVRSKFPPGSQRSSQPRYGPFEDHGITFAPPSQARNGEPVTRFKSKTAAVAPHDDSLDEIDLLSPVGSQERSKSRSRSVEQSWKETEEGVEIDGSFHAFVPEFRPRTLPKFKKSKKQAEIGDVEVVDIGSSKGSTTPPEITQIAAPSRSRPMTPPLPRPPPRKTTARRTKIPFDDDHNPHTAGAGSSSQATTRSTRRQQQDVLPREITYLSDDNKADETPRPSKERPKPRPAYAAKEASRGKESVSFPDLAPLDKGKGRENTPPRAAKDMPLPSPLEQERRPQTRSRNKGKERERMSPVDLPPSSSSTAPPTRSPNAGKDRGKEKGRIVSNPIDGLSPLSSPADRSLRRTRSQSKLERFPVGSPLSGKKAPTTPTAGSRKAKPKARRKAGHKVVPESEDEDEDEGSGPSKRSYAPFPMETQMFASIQRSPTSRLETYAATDESEDLDQEESKRQRKKMRENPDLILAAIMRSDGEMSDDCLFMDPTVDPKTLCPWCDERLPPRPTPHLLSLIKVARRASRPDPRPSNSLGLQASLTAFVSVCQRHKFESHQIPLAKSKGWPLEINWQALSSRVQALKGRLREILEDVDERFNPGTVREDDGWEEEEGVEGRARRSSAFWQDLVKSVRKKGARSLGSVREQFATFDRTQPGYYGELGYFIIHQTIYNLFPPSSIDPDTTLPLAPTDFIQLILVPEAAVSLVQEDLEQDRTDAIHTLRESAEYGVAMFPDDHAAGSKAVEVGEQLVMERALARRRELEGVEGFEAELWKTGKDFSQSPKRQRQRSARSRSRARGTDGETSDSEVQALSVEPRRSQRQPRKVSRTDVGASSDSTSTPDSDSPKRKAKAKGARDKDWEPRKKTKHVERTSSRAEFELLQAKTPQENVRPRPKPKPIMPESGSSQPKATMTSDSKGALRLRESSPVVLDPPAPSNIEVPNEAIDVDADTTPRPKKRPFYPLLAAKERRRRSPESRESEVARQCGLNLVKPIGSAHTTEDERAGSDASLGSEASKASRRSRHKTPRQTDTTEGFDWLLSDSSVPSSPPSLVYPLDGHHRSDDSHFS